MKLTQEQTVGIYKSNGVWLLEACDGCGRPINSNFSYVRGKETLCSQKCRDGFEYVAGTCAYCGGSLADKKRGTRFCGDKCRKRFVRLNPAVEDTPKIADSGVAESTSYKAKLGGGAVLPLPPGFGEENRA